MSGEEVEVDDEAKRLCKSVLRHELEAAEETEELNHKFGVGQINVAMSEVVEEVTENIDDPDREQKVFLLVHQMGKSIGSESMARRGKELYEEWVEKHG